VVVAVAVAFVGAFRIVAVVSAAAVRVPVLARVFVVSVH
jgi:hypothetical protein